METVIDILQFLPATASFALAVIAALFVLLGVAAVLLTIIYTYFLFEFLTENLVRNKSVFHLW